MTRYTYFTATTLDGFLADEHDSLDWLFEQHGDPDAGPGAHGDVDTFLAGIGALVMGATTYRWVVDHLREAGEAWPYAVPTFVFTHRDLEPAADTVAFVSGAPADHRAAVEEAAGARDVWVVGAVAWRPTSPRPGCSTGCCSRSPRSRSAPGGRCYHARSTSG